MTFFLVNFGGFSKFLTQNPSKMKKFFAIWIKKYISKRNLFLNFVFFKITLSTTWSALKVAEVFLWESVRLLNKNLFKCVWNCCSIQFLAIVNCLWSVQFSNRLRCELWKIVNFFWRISSKIILLDGLQNVRIFKLIS